MASRLINALEPRARLIADILANSIENPGPWQGYHRDEPLIGVLETADSIKWRRAGVSPDAVYGTMVFGFLKVRGVSAEADGEDEIIASNVTEHHEDVLSFAKPIKYTETLRHTFSKTMNVEEATEQAWKVSAKAAFALAYGGVTGSVEAAAEYGQKLARKSSESTTISDEITKTIEIVGPVHISWVAERSTDTILRKWNAVPDIDFKLYWRSADSGWEWSNYHDVFVPAARGESPVNTDYSIFASSSPSHELFEQHPTSDADIALLESPLATPIPFTATYQTVNRQSIKAI